MRATATFSNRASATGHPHTAGTQPAASSGSLSLGWQQQQSHQVLGKGQNTGGAALGAQQHCPANGEEGRKEDFFFYEAEKQTQTTKPDPSEQNPPQQVPHSQKSF